MQVYFIYRFFKYYGVHLLLSLLVKRLTVSFVAIIYFILERS